MFHFYTLWKLQKSRGFLTFPGGIEMECWLEMDWIWISGIFQAIIFKRISSLFFKIGAFKNITIFTGKRLCWSLFFNNVTCLQACNFIKKRSRHRCFPVNVGKFLRTASFTEHLRWLLLNFRKKLKQINVNQLLVTCHEGKYFNRWTLTYLRTCKQILVLKNLFKINEK